MQKNIVSHLHVSWIENQGEGSEGCKGDYGEEVQRRVGRDEQKARPEESS